MTHVITHITQEEAEQLIPDVPGQAVASLITGSKQGIPITINDGTWRILTEQSPETSQELRITLSSALTPAEGRALAIRRVNVSLMVNVPGKFIVAMAPMYEKSGARRGNTYRPLSKEIVKIAFDGNAPRLRSAREQNNLETVDGERRFMFPSSVILPDDVGRRSRNSVTDDGVPGTLGKSSASAAAARKSFTPDEIGDLMIEALDEETNGVEEARKTLLDACDGDDESQVPGLYQGSVQGDAGNTTVPSTYALAPSKNPDTAARRMDLLNHAAAGVPLALPLHKERATKAKKSAKAGSEISSSSLPRPSDPAESKFPMSSKKRSSSADPPRNKKPASDIGDELMASALGGLTTITEGILSTKHAEGLLGDTKVAGFPLPPAIAAGAMLSKANAAQMAQMVAAAKALASQGEAAVAEALMAEMKKRTMYEMLFKPCSPTTFMNEVFTPLVLLAQAVWIKRSLGKTVSDEVDQVLKTFVIDATNETVATAARVKNECDSKDEEITQLKKRLSDKEEELEECVKQLAEATKKGEKVESVLEAQAAGWSDNDE